MGMLDFGSSNGEPWPPPTGSAPRRTRKRWSSLRLFSARFTSRALVQEAQVHLAQRFEDGFELPESRDSERFSPFTLELLHNTANGGNRQRPAPGYPHYARTAIALVPHALDVSHLLERAKQLIHGLFAHASTPGERAWALAIRARILQDHQVRRQQVGEARIHQSGADARARCGPCGMQQSADHRFTRIHFDHRVDNVVNSMYYSIIVNKVYYITEEM